MDKSVIGKEIDGYRIEEILGRGGMGIVYKAEQVALSRPVAIKRLIPRLENDESFVKRFRREARAIARIDSSHIVQVYSLGETEIGLVIVMEYVEGGTLKKHVASGGVDWKHAVPVVQQALTALEHAHQAGIVHRDVKPHNILLSGNTLTSRPTIKLTDFGVAKVNTSGDPSRTVTEGVYGTLHYMPPEQVKGHGEVDHRSDIYALGMTCYELLTGEVPFDETDSEYTVMRKIAEGDLPQLGASVPDVPDRLRRAIDKATAYDPSNRFRSAGEMKAVLGELEGMPDLANTQAERAPIPPNFDLSEEENRAEEDRTLTAATKERPTAIDEPDADRPDAGRPGVDASDADASEALKNRTTAGIVAAGVVVVAVLGGLWYGTTALSTGSDGNGARPIRPPIAATNAGPPEIIEAQRNLGFPPLCTMSAAVPCQTGQPDVPDVIERLLRIDRAARLRARADSLQAAGVLRGGRQVADPSDYYVLVEAITGPEAGRVAAVLSRPQNGERIDLTSGNTVDDWREQYETAQYTIRYVSVVEQ